MFGNHLTSAYNKLVTAVAQSTRIKPVLLNSRIGKALCKFTLLTIQSYHEFADVKVLNLNIVIEILVHKEKSKGSCTSCRAGWWWHHSVVAVNFTTRLLMIGQMVDMFGILLHLIKFRCFKCSKKNHESANSIGGGTKL